MIRDPSVSVRAQSCVPRFVNVCESAMDDRLTAILREWQVAAEDVRNLAEQEVYDLETLLNLSHEDIKEVFKKVGPRANFSSKLEKLRQEVSDFTMTTDDLERVAKAVIQEELIKRRAKLDEASGHSEDTNDHLTNEDPFEGTSDHGDSDTLKPSNSAIQPCGDDAVSNSLGAITATLQHANSNTGSQKRKRPASSTDFDLRGLLDTCVDGKVVKAYYQENKNLSGEYRSMLADILINDYVKEDEDRKLPYAAEESMADAILELFPSEERAIWVSPALSRTKACGRGVIVTRYYHKRRIMRKSGLIKKSDGNGGGKAAKSASVSNNIDDPITADNILWLQNNKQPWSRVVETWQATTQYRLDHQLGVKSMAVAEYISLYPALRDDSGYLLLETDYESKFPDSKMNLYTEWGMLEGFVLSKVPDACVQDIKTSQTKEGKWILTLQYLPYLFPVFTAAKKGKKQWRPSRQEVGEGLILHVETVGDIATNLASRMQDKYEVFGCTLPPQAIVVGPDVDAITHCYVRVNGVLYLVENPRKAVDITFKLMHALDTSYHKEAEREWLFFEKAIYKINEQDKNPLTSKVLTVVKDYEAFKKKHSSGSSATSHER